MTRFNEKVNLQRVDTSLSAPFESHAQNLARFANELGQITQQYAQAGSAWGAFADKKASSIGEQQAATDIAAGKGKKPDYKGGKTPYQMSYDEKMRAAHESELSKDAQLELQNIYLNSKGDTALYNQSVEAYKKGITKELDADTSARFSESFDKMAHSVRLKVNETEISNNLSNAESSILGDLEEKKKTAAISVSELDGQAIIDSNKDYLTTIQKLQAFDPVKYNEDWARQEISKHGKELTNYSVWRDVDDAIKSGGILGGYARLEQLSSSTPQDYTPIEWEETLSKKYAELKGMESQNKSALKSNKAYVNYLITQAEKAISDGANVPDDQITRLGEMVAPYNDPVMSAKYGQIKTSKTMKGVSTADLTEFVTGQGKVGIGSTNTFNNAKSELNARNAAVKKDPIGYAESQGLISESQVDFANPESVNQFINDAHKVKEFYNLDTLPPLSSAQVNGIVASLDTTDITGKMAIIKNLNQLGDAKFSTLEEIDKKGAGVFAMVAATGDDNVMGIVFRGQELQKNKLYSPLKGDDRKESMADYEKYVGDAYGSEDKGNIYKAALDYLAATNPGGDYDYLAFRKAVRAITGGIGDRDGFHYELPRNVTEDDFEDYIDRFTPQALDYFGGVNVPEDEAIKLLRNGKVIAEGNGKYSILDTLTNRKLGNKKGGLFTFSYDQNAPISVNNARMYRSKKQHRPIPMEFK